MQKNIIETLVGFLVIIIAGLFVLYIYNLRPNNIKSGYTLTATFENVDGVVKGSEVKVGGIVIGKVNEITLDKKMYDAILTLTIEDDIKIPTDSRAAITTNGFIGNKYVAIIPGGDFSYLEHGDKIRHTQSAVNLESILGKFIYSKGSPTN